MNETENIKIMSKCPRFKSCSVPKCPLDYYRDQRTVLNGEPKCEAFKSIRMKIGKGTQLKYQGMTKREWDGKKRWDARPEAEKQALIERGKEALKKLHSK